MKKFVKFTKSKFVRGGVTFNEYIQTLIEFFPVRANKRVELIISSEAFVLISVGELNENKNNSVIISAMNKIKKDNIHYVVCGVGQKQTELQKQADNSGLHDNIHFIGYRNDLRELYKMADCFVMPSFREGLSRSIMEAMASGLPCIVSKIRGNVDLIEDKKGGFLCEPTDTDGWAESIRFLSENKELCIQMHKFNIEKIVKFDSSVVEKCIYEIYQDL